MKGNDHFKSAPYLHVALLVSVFVALILAGYSAYEYRLLASELLATKEKNFELEADLTEAGKAIRYLNEEVNNKQATVDSFQAQIASLGSTVGTLDKLAKTDKELLRKYSKVYFLNENYIPVKLTEVDDKFVLTEANGNLQIHSQVAPYLKKLLEAAESSGRRLVVASAYRSFDTQATLKTEYKVIYGAGTANQFSADQGYSEHQLGTAVDLSTTAVGGAFSTFKSDPAYKWLKDNAHKYGFTLSYPEGNTYYKFEPWHWRFVGIDLATHLHNEGKYFYDLDQREIDTYLIKLFD